MAEDFREAAGETEQARATYEEAMLSGDPGRAGWRMRSSTRFRRTRRACLGANGSDARPDVPVISPSQCIAFSTLRAMGAMKRSQSTHLGRLSDTVVNMVDFSHID